MLIKNQGQIIKNGKNPELKEIRKEVLEILTSAVKAVDPYNVVKTKIDGKFISFESKRFNLSDYKNIYLIGFGKASIGMAQAVCDKITIKKGIILTNELKKTIKNKCISILVGTHPIPSQRNIDATDKLLDVAEKCNDDDLLIVLISGGGSALLCKPRVRIYDLQDVTNLLLKSGADIKEINTIRKHLSFVKGGQITKYVKCTIISFIISDIVEDPIEFIASGPTFPDSTTFIDAQNILKKYKLWNKIPSSVRQIITNGIHKKIPETPKNYDKVFDNVFNFIVANNEIACKAAEEKAEELGYKTMLLTTNLVGEAKERSSFLFEKALNFHTYAKKMIFISGGETTVTIKGKGRGGRNQEMVLSCVNEIANKNFIFSSFATDGIDGTSDAAGAIADSYTLERAKKNKLDPNIFLNENNSYNFFKVLGDYFITGPTGTNVMDIQLLIKLK